MSKEIKMSNVFSLPLNAVCERDYCDEYNFNIYDSSGDILIPCVPDDVDHEAIVEAVNGHDTLTEQVKQLREEKDELEKDKFQLRDTVEYLHKKLIEEGRRYGGSINRKKVAKLLEATK